MKYIFLDDDSFDIKDLYKMVFYGCGVCVLTKGKLNER